MTDEQHPLDALRHGRRYNGVAAAEAAITDEQIAHLHKLVEDLQQRPDSGAKGGENTLKKTDELTFTEYQARAALTSVAAARSLEYLLPGLAAEVGELCDVFAKATRDNDGTLTNGDLVRIQKEAGDVLWFLSELCRLKELPLDSVARANLAKLADRQARGTLRGSGDDR